MREHPLILVADDEPQMVGVISYGLQNAGFEVAMAYDGQQALDQFEKHHPDLVILDVEMPVMDGFVVCQKVRTDSTIPVLLLTVRDEQEAIIKGLELGADDYMTKPFSIRELILRIKAILRRTHDTNRHIVDLPPLHIDFDRHLVTLQELPVELSALEFRLLDCLVANTGRVLTWQALLKEVWELEIWQGDKEMVKLEVYRLRQKLEPNPGSPIFIHTKRGVGYYFDKKDLEGAAASP
ncbi:MAG: two-component system, OmpR family, alkaline phosphatase synthesis response regulator PhoP [Chloroflexota bacterium]|nr:two-component system, OmpR family, alkaline phosphatase synthesis response regulator PhoP [Chloroflexota bacterium]